MKRLFFTLLTVVLIFNGCEKDEQDCSCGIVLEQTTWSDLAGSVEENGEDAYNGYMFGTVENYCTGNIGSFCITWAPGDPEPEIQEGDEYCMEFQSEFQSTEYDNIDGISTATNIWSGCVDLDILFE